MTLLDLMKTRRSIRKYAKQKVEDEKLEKNYGSRSLCP